MYWRKLIPSHRHPPAEVYNLLSFTSLSWKGATTPESRLPTSLGRELQPLLSFTSLSWKGDTTPCFCLPASPGRELLPPVLVYQLPLEGIYNPLTEGFNPQHHCRPRFINFQTGSNSFNTTLYLSTITLCPLLPIEQWNHCNQNVKDNPDFIKICKITFNLEQL